MTTPSGKKLTGRKKAAVYGAKGYTSPRALRGPGIFATCWRGKEGRCVAEMYDLLDQVTAILYPPSRLQQLEKTRPKPVQPAEMASGQADVEMGLDSDEDDLEMSIEDSIAKELASMRESAKKVPAKDKKQTHRFLSLNTDTECVAFISLAWPYDPKEITEYIVNELLDTGVNRTRHVLRLEPTSQSCHALTEAAVAKTIQDTIKKEFLEYSEKNKTSTITYSIEPCVRSHVKPHSRDSLIQQIGAVVRALSEDSLTVSANLANPDLVVIPNVLKSYFGLGVVDGKLYKRGRKFNLDAIGAQMRKEKAAGQEISEAGRVAKAATADDIS